MKNSIEVEAALRLALEALKEADKLCPVNSHAEIFVREAITAIKEALMSVPDGAQPALASEQKRPQNCGTGYCSCIECVMEPEPVAWANPNDLQNFDMKVRTNGGPLHTVPLYTTPQQLKPLTIDQIASIAIDRSKPDGIIAFVRAIEAAHGIYAPPELKEQP